jgi:hypothetical protein
VFSLFGGLSAALAQGAPSGCGVPKVDAFNDRGLERITIRSPCRHDEQIYAKYGFQQEETTFSKDGVASFNIALTNERGPITLSYMDRTLDIVQVDTASLSTVLRITLQWDLPVDLNLHVVEPGGIVNGKGDATANHPPEQYGLKGRIDLTDDGSGLSPFRESYVLPNRLERPSDIFTVYVEDVSRGRSPSAAHCDAGDLAQIEFQIIIVDRGKVRRQPFKLIPVPCNQEIPDRIYFFKPRL